MTACSCRLHLALHLFSGHTVMCWPIIWHRRRYLEEGGGPSQNTDSLQIPLQERPSVSRREGLDPGPPSRPYFISFEFPRLPTKVPYDNHPGGFWDFSERTGWVLDGQREHRKFPNELETLNPVLAKLDDKHECRKRTIPELFLKNRPNDALSIKCFRTDGTGASLSEQVAFLQTWLFFGVLAEMNTITGVPIPDFRAGGTPEVLSTAALDVLLRQWLSALETLDNDDHEQKRSRMLEIVQHAMSLQTCISVVLLSIRILFRAILLALALSSQLLSDLQLLMHPALAQSFPANWDELKDYATDEMLAAGWCTSECKLLEQYDGTYNFFAARLSSGRWRMDHSGCHDALCAADYVNEETYTTVHVQEGCNCEWARVNQEELCAVLDRGQVPRIVVSEDMKLVVGDSQGYMAISHVWAHGLGNPDENALPRCQVERLATYISGLQVAGEPPLAVWMDTLCIPVHPDMKAYRKKAIKLMSQTYQNASTVLVLDRELQRLDTTNVSLLEQDLITAFVGWTRRLWTLQEAALANRLYVQLLRFPYKLENAESEADEHNRLLAQICFREDIANLTCRRIPPMATLKQSVFETSPPTSGLPIAVTTTALQKLAHAVKHRATSKMEDEPLILAITLGLEIGPIIDAPDTGTRMAALLVLLRDVPADIIFGAWSRLDNAPFRWAPRSLLGFPLQAPQSFGPAAVCNSYGLHATYEGLVVDHGARATMTRENVYAVDKVLGMKYEFQARKDGAVATFPETFALIFRAYGIGGDTAVANILRRWNENGQDVIEVTIVGYLTMVGSGVGLEVNGQPLFEGALTSGDQHWCIT
ncbi:hypothetical protein V5O48_018117 [Marasmius crinis-equi]|uniref:Heterokaryon incompatibility domain-containing protein n=1 Tax=Marasmius crinis-equi TaxID=585013 RepID=A0ABR3EM41_9AGAR